VNKLRSRFIFICTIAVLLLVLPQNLHGQFIEKKECQIFFDSDIDLLDKKSKAAIRKTILDLNDQTIKEIYINGHADSDASDEYNIALSERRAENTKAFLASLGVKSRMVKLQAFGEARPMSDLKKLNRRVDIVFVYELFAIPEKYDGKKYPGLKVIQGNVYNAQTKEKLPSSFVVEIAGKSNFRKTNRDAYFRLKLNNKYNVTVLFSKTGFWSKELELSKARLATVKDTLTLEIFLEPIKVKEKLSFKNIYFYTDTDKLKPESKPDLDSLLAFMQLHDKANIEIQGHMNFPRNLYASPMQVLYNRTLSHNRAKAIFNHLVKNGVDSRRMTYKGMSNFKMVYPIPKTSAEEDANKRVEVWVLEKTSS